MNVKFLENYIVISTADMKKQYCLEQYHNANKIKAGWRLPKTIWVMRELLKTFPELKQSTEFITQGKVLRDEMDSALAVRQRTPVYSGPLRQYQASDVNVLKELHAAGIFNEPRTGKTPTTITLLKELGLKKNLIVAPASLVLNWKKELEKWWPEANVFIYHGPKRDSYPYYRSAVLDKKVSVMVASKDVLRIDVPKENELFDGHHFDTCVVDEAHFLRNYKSKQSKAIFAVNTRRRYALTGTPTIKHASDIFGILHFLYPKQFNSYWQFVDRYFEQSLNFMGRKEIGDVKKYRAQELQELIGLISVQRTRKEVMPWLPSKQYSTLICEMTDKQRKLYNEMKQFFAATNDEQEVNTVNVITQLMRMRQLCQDPRLLGFTEVGAKTKALLEKLEDRKEPIIIMSWFTSYLKLLKGDIESLGLKVGMIHGEQTPSEKQDAVEDFQNNRTVCLLANIASAGVGFTLDAAEEILFLDKDWNPAINEQAEDRICPVSEDRTNGRKFDIISLVCNDSIDARIDELLTQKTNLTEVINKGGRDAIQKLLGV